MGRRQTSATKPCLNLIMPTAKDTDKYLFISIAKTCKQYEEKV